MNFVLYLFAPVQTIFPELNISAVVLGSRILMMTAANRFGLYSAFLAWRAIFFKSNLHPRLTVDTMFLNKNRQIFAEYNWLTIHLDHNKLRVPKEHRVVNMIWSWQRYHESRRQWCSINIFIYFFKSVFVMNGKSTMLVGCGYKDELKYK